MRLDRPLRVGSAGSGRLARTLLQQLLVCVPVIVERHTAADMRVPGALLPHAALPVGRIRSGRGAAMSLVDDASTDVDEIAFVDAPTFPDPSDGLYIFNRVLDAIFAVDMVLQFFTAVAKRPGDDDLDFAVSLVSPA